MELCKQSTAIFFFFKIKFPDSVKHFQFIFPHFELEFDFKIFLEAQHLNGSECDQKTLNTTLQGLSIDVKINSIKMKWHQDNCG